MTDPSKINVMLVDDSSIIRSLLNEVLSREEDIHVAGLATNGKLALPRVRYHKPDVVILDYEMPEMDGLETLRHIVKDSPDTRVIMFSSHTVEGARVTMQALEIGAVDFVPKPETGKHGDPRQYVRDEILPRIRGLKVARTPGALARRAPKTAGTLAGGAKQATFDSPPVGHSGKFDICAIGISTGGPVALKALFSKMPALNGSVLITQHMPPLFTAQLAETLDRVSPMSVKEAQEGVKIARATAFVAPGDKHLVFRRSEGRLILHLDSSPPYLHCRPSVNYMFNSLAEVAPSRTLCVIMTGMGSDGLEGIRKLREKGAYVLGQSEESCVVYGMPAAPAKEGLVHEVHDIEGLAARISHLLGER